MAGVGTAGRRRPGCWGVWQVLARRWSLTHPWHMPHSAAALPAPPPFPPQAAIAKLTEREAALINAGEESMAELEQQAAEWQAKYQALEEGAQVGVRDGHASMHGARHVCTCVPCGDALLGPPSLFFKHPLVSPCTSRLASLSAAHGDSPPTTPLIVPPPPAGPPDTPALQPVSLQRHFTPTARRQAAAEAAAAVHEVDLATAEARVAEARQAADAIAGQLAAQAEAHALALQQESASWQAKFETLDASTKVGGLGVAGAGVGAGGWQRGRVPTMEQPATLTPWPPKRTLPPLPPNQPINQPTSQAAVAAASGREMELFKVVDTNKVALARLEESYKQTRQQVAGGWGGLAGAGSGEPGGSRGLTGGVGTCSYGHPGRGWVLRCNVALTSTAPLQPLPTDRHQPTARRPSRRCGRPRSACATTSCRQRCVGAACLPACLLGPRADPRAGRRARIPLRRVPRRTPPKTLHTTLALTAGCTGTGAHAGPAHTHARSVAQSLRCLVRTKARP